jgi:hypothetical protein
MAIKRVRSVGVVALLILTGAACESAPPLRLRLPMAPTAIYVPPPPASFAPLEFTPIEIGAVFQERVDNPQECIDDLGWPCRYFRLTAPASGTLTVTVTSPRGTRTPGDLTVSEMDRMGYTWAQFATENETRVTAPVVAGRSYDITLWYVTTGLDIELRTSVQ